jgi:hypothetical protein
MKSYSFGALIPACLLVLFPEYVISPSSAEPAATTTPAPDGTHDAGIQFGFDDLMSMLIQPRHLKLFYAGTQGNWELAAAESRNLRSSFAHIAQTIPKYLNMDVEAATKTIIEPKMQAVDAAIAAADPKQFATAFNNLTVACNACHTYMEHPYIAIKVPDSAATSVFTDQDFRPSP